MSDLFESLFLVHGQHKNWNWERKEHRFFWTSRHNLMSRKGWKCSSCSLLPLRSAGDLSFTRHIWLTENAPPANFSGSFQLCLHFLVIPLWHSTVEFQWTAFRLLRVTWVIECAPIWLKCCTGTCWEVQPIPFLFSIKNCTYTMLLKCSGQTSFLPASACHSSEWLFFDVGVVDHDLEHRDYARGIRYKWSLSLAPSMDYWRTPFVSCEICLVLESFSIH